MERSLSAPGKLFLSGEYAVLWGGTARVAAVGPRAYASVRRRDDREVHLVLPGLRLIGEATPLGIHFTAPVPQQLRFAAQTLDLVLRAHGRESLGFELSLGSSPTSAMGQKLGMGGSARTCVLAAEAGRYILEDRFDALKVALVAHATAQLPAGSGGDVAAIFAGGAIRYRRYALDPLIDASREARWRSALATSPPVDLLRLPAFQFPLAYAFAGSSASTPLMIAQVEASTPASERERFVSRSDELGQQVEDGLAKGDFESLREAVLALEGLLGELGPVETEAISRLLALASSQGCVGKISGAGGGDGCVIFAPDFSTRDAMLETLAARGFLAMPLELEPGLRGETATISLA